MEHVRLLRESCGGGDLSASLFRRERRANNGMDRAAHVAVAREARARSVVSGTLRPRRDMGWSWSRGRRELNNSLGSDSWSAIAELSYPSTLRRTQQLDGKSRAVAVGKWFQSRILMPRPPAVRVWISSGRRPMARRSSGREGECSVAFGPCAPTRGVERSYPVLGCFYPSLPSSHLHPQR